MTFVPEDLCPRRGVPSRRPEPPPALMDNNTPIADAVSVVDDAECTDDEVMEACTLEGLTGARVSILSSAGPSRPGTVRSVSPNGSRMRVCLDADDSEIWVDADDSWQLDTAAPDAAAPDTEQEASLTEADIEAAPTLEGWSWKPNGALCGHVYGKPGFRDGELMTTSTVHPEKRFSTHVVSTRHSLASSNCK